MHVAQASFSSLIASQLVHSLARRCTEACQCWHCRSSSKVCQHAAMPLLATHGATEHPSPFRVVQEYLRCCCVRHQKLGILNVEVLQPLFHELNVIYCKCVVMASANVPRLWLLDVICSLQAWSQSQH